MSTNIPPALPRFPTLPSLPSASASELQPSLDELRHLPYSSPIPLNLSSGQASQAAHATFLDNDVLRPSPNMQDRIRRTVSSRAAHRTMSAAKPALANLRHSFDRSRRKGPGVTRVNTLKNTENAAWEAVKYDLTETSQVQMMITAYVSKSWKIWFRKTTGKPYFTVEVSSTGKRWKPLALDVGFREVLSFGCPSTKLDSMMIRVTVRTDRAKGGRMDLGSCTVRVLELLDPSQSGGAKGGGGGYWVGVYEGEERNAPVGAVGRVEVRAVVGNKGGSFGLGIKIWNAMSVRRELKGVEVRAWRSGGGRQKLPLGEVSESGLWISERLLWFGLKEGGFVRLEWVKKGFVCARMEIGVEQLVTLDKGSICQLLWQAGKDEFSVCRLLIVEKVKRREGQVHLEFTLTR